MRKRPSQFERMVSLVASVLLIWGVMSLTSGSVSAQDAPLASPAAAAVQTATAEPIAPTFVPPPSAETATSTATMPATATESATATETDQSTATVPATATDSATATEATTATIPATASETATSAIALTPTSSPVESTSTAAGQVSPTESAAPASPIAGTAAPSPAASVTAPSTPTTEAIHAAAVQTFSLTVRIVDPNNALPPAVCLTLTPVDSFTDNGPICTTTAHPGIRDFSFSIVTSGRFSDIYHGTLSLSTGMPSNCALTLTDLAFTFSEATLPPSSTVAVSLGCTTMGATLTSTQTSVSISSDGRLPNLICGTWIPADSSTVTSSAVQCISTDWNSGTLTPNAGGSSTGSAVNLKFELLPGFEACAFGHCHSAIDANCALDSTPAISSADLNGPRTFAVNIMCSGPPEGWTFEWIDTVRLGNGPFPEQFCATYVATDATEIVTNHEVSCASPTVFMGQHLATIVMLITVTGERYPYSLRFEVTSALPAGCSVVHDVSDVFVLPSYPPGLGQGEIVYNGASTLVCSSSSPTPTATATATASATPLATTTSTSGMSTSAATSQSEPVATKQAAQGVSALPVTGTGMAARDGSGASSIWIALLLAMLGFVGIAFGSRWHASRKRGQ